MASSNTDQQQGEPGPISPTRVMFVNMMWSTRGLCLALSKQPFVFDMLDSIVPLPGRTQPERIPTYFPSPHPFTVKVGSIKFDVKTQIANQ